MAANQPGKIITFYSYKGGTGRSMALANVAWVLASNGRRVLAVDWDLEAPGLHRYFYPFLIDKELASLDGIIDFMIGFRSEASVPPEKGEVLPRDWYKSHANKILDYAASLEWEFPGNGRLDFIPAGRQGDSYPSRVTSFNWQNFYDKIGGGVFIESMKEAMRGEYDYILLDSRTGVSDASGICTVQMPDALVVCFTMNHQSIEGAAAVAASVYEQRRGAGPSVKVFPVPMRVENGEKEKLELRRGYARDHFDRFPAHIPHEKRDKYWGEVEVIYVPYYAYEEILAPFGDKRGQTISLLASVERLTAYLTHDDPSGEVKSLIAPPEPERQRVLAEYARQFLETVPSEEPHKVAENVFSSFTPELQAVAKQVFTRLVRVSPSEEVGGDARLRVKMSDLGVVAGPVIGELIYRQLVLLGRDEATGEETIQLAHDALVQKWGRMRGWLAEDRDFLLWRQGLQLSLTKWESTGHDNAALLHGAFLAEAQRYWTARAGALTPDEALFITESVRAEGARREADEQLRQKEEQARLETAKVRKEKKRLVFRLGLSIAALLLLMAYPLVFHRERTLFFFGFIPPPFTSVWSDDFLISPDGAPNNSLWDYPVSGQWVIERGEGTAEEDGRLVVKSTHLGVTKIKSASFYDFKAEFKVRIAQGTKAAWVFRAQPDKQEGYLFVLEKKVSENNQSSLVLNGYVYRGLNDLEPMDERGGHEIPFRDCCRDTDAFRIRAEVEDYEFRYWVKIESDIDPEDPRADTGVNYFIEPFKDRRLLFRHGSFGLLGVDDASRMTVEFVRITAGDDE